MSQCTCGCHTGYAACEEGRNLLAEAMYLQSLIPEVLPLQLTDDQARLIERLWVLGDLWLKHLGEYVPDRLS